MDLTGYYWTHEWMVKRGYISTSCKENKYVNKYGYKRSNTLGGLDNNNDWRPA